VGMVSIWCPDQELNLGPSA